MDVESGPTPPSRLGFEKPANSFGRFPGYHDVHTIGHGAQGKVKSAIRNKDGLKVALKFLDPERMSVAEITRMRQEHAHMIECSRHPHVIQLYGVQWDFQYRSKNGEKKRRVVFEMAYAEGGEFFDVLSVTGRLPEVIARTYFKQLMSGLEHCHLKGISHRDLKPENLLLDRFYNLKIADFGLSARFKQAAGPIFHTSIVGTPLYLAPEVSSGHYFGPLADIWSAGVVLFIMLTGVPPFQRPVKGDWWFNRLVNHEYEAFWKAHRRNAVLSKEVEDLLQKILEVDYRRRATTTVIKTHPWIRKRACSSEQLRSEFARRQREVHKRELERRMQFEATSSTSATSASSAPATTSPRDTGGMMGMRGAQHALSFDRVFDPMSSFTARSVSDGGKDGPTAPPVPPSAASAAKGSVSKSAASPSTELKTRIEKVLQTRSHFTCLLTRRPAKQSDVIARLQQACSRMRGKYKIVRNPEPGTSSLKCEVKTQSGLVKIRITTIGVSDSGKKKTDAGSMQHHVVEIRRLMGDSLQFRGLFEVVCRDRNVSDLLVSRYALAASDGAFKIL